MQTHPLIAAVSLCALLAACGGGDGSTSTAGSGNGNGNGNASVTCDAARFSNAVSVAAPTATQIATYAGTYVGDEGTQGPNFGDPFVKTGTATLVLASDGSVTYNGTAMTLQSECVVSSGGAVSGLSVHFASATGEGHVDLDAGAMSGVSPASVGLNFVLIQNGVRQ